VSLARIQQFDTTDPAKLGRQLSALEDNTSKAIDQAQAASSPLPIASVFTATAAKGVVSLGPDQQLSVDTSVAGASIVLPALKPTNFGRRFVLIKPVAANAVTVLCQDSTVLCNGAALPSLAAVGVYVFYCDKYGYYR
jgi:hypothetical protein